MKCICGDKNCTGEAIIIMKTEFSFDELRFIQMASNIIVMFDSRVLVAVVAGQLDLNEMAKREMVNRGLNVDGTYKPYNKTEEASAS